MFQIDITLAFCRLSTNEHKQWINEHKQMLYFMGVA